jgi:hypothetical protein
MIFLALEGDESFLKISPKPKTPCQISNPKTEQRGGIGDFLEMRLLLSISTSLA